MRAVPTTIAIIAFFLALAFVAQFKASLDRTHVAITEAIQAQEELLAATQAIRRSFNADFDQIDGARK